MTSVVTAILFSPLGLAGCIAFHAACNASYMRQDWQVMHRLRGDRRALRAMVREFRATQQTATQSASATRAGGMGSA